MPATYDESSSDDDLYDNFEKYKSAVLAKIGPSPPKVRKVDVQVNDTSSEDELPSPSSEDKPTLRGKKPKKTPEDATKPPEPPKPVEVLTLDDEIELEILTGKPCPKAAVAPQSKRAGMKPAAAVKKRSKTDKDAQLLKRLEEDTDEIEVLEAECLAVDTEPRCKIQLKDMCGVGPELTVQWRMKAPFSELSDKYAKVLCAKSGRMRFWLGDRQCAVDSTPEREMFSRSEPNVLEYMDDVAAAPPKVDNANCLELKFQVKGAKPVLLSVGKDEKFSAIQARLAKTHGIGQRCRLVFDSDPVDEDATPTELDMEDGDCIDVHAM